MNAVSNFQTHRSINKPSAVSHQKSNLPEKAAVTGGKKVKVSIKHYGSKNYVQYNRRLNYGVPTS